MQNGRVSLEELQQVLEAASKEYSHFEEHAKFLERKNSRYVGGCGAALLCAACRRQGGSHHPSLVCLLMRG